MKSIIAFLLCWSIALSMGTTIQGHHSAVARKKAQSTYLVEQDCEGTGTPPGWVNGTGSWEYSTAPAPLAGSESFGGSATTQAYKTFANTSDCWVYCRYNLSSLTPQDYMISLSNATTYVARIRYVSGGVLRALDAGGVIGASAGGTLVVNTTYHVWMHYIAGTGSDSQTIVYRSTDGIRGTAVASISTGKATLPANRVTLQITTGATAIFDTIRVSASEIGDNPL